MSGMLTHVNIGFKGTVCEAAVIKSRGGMIQLQWCACLLSDLQKLGWFINCQSQLHGEVIGDFV